MREGEKSTSRVVLFPKKLSGRKLFFETLGDFRGSVVDYKKSCHSRESNLIPDLENPISPRRSLKFIRLLRVVY